METGLFTALALVAGAALLLVLVGVLVVVVRSGRRSQQQLIASRADIETLHAEVRALSDEVAASRVASAARQQEQAPPQPPPTAEYLITTAGVSTLRQAQDTSRSSTRASDGVVVSATIGRPLVKLAALGYGVRRALAPQTRNRIAFEMRREVKRARKQRKREQRQPYRPDAEAAA